LLSTSNSFSQETIVNQIISVELIDTIETWLDNKNEDQVIFYIDSLYENDPTFYKQNLEYFLRFRGIDKLNKDDYIAAFKLFFDALKLSQRKNNEIEVAKTSKELGIVFLHFREPQLAIKMFKEAEILFTKLNEEKLSTKALYLNAVSHKRLKKYGISNNILLKVMSDYKAKKDSSGLALTYNAIGLNYKNLKEVDKSVEYFSKAITIFESQKKPLNLAKAYNNLANIYQIAKKWDLAILNNEKSIQLKKSFNDTLGMAVGYINLSVIYKKKGNLKTAFIYGNKSIAMIEQIGDRANNRKIGVYSLMSELHEKQGEYNAALNYARKAKKLNERSRIDKEATLIELFEKKQDVKFYTISDSLMINQQILKEKNETLTQEKTDVINYSLIIVISMLFGIIIIISWKYRSTNKIKKELEVTNEELSATRISKEEKEVLLQEIHHRVKNNMQIISSLIRLQKNKINDDSMNELFIETQHRITTMAMVHELLYQTKNFENLELKAYLIKLIDHLFRSYETNTKVKQIINISDDKASIDHVIPIGLLVNEVVSNSLKHAFNDNDEDAEISIQFYAEKNKGYFLEISDNGTEKDNNSTKENHGSLGMELIDSLVLQLDGVMTLNKTKGYHYTIKIPKI